MKDLIIECSALKLKDYELRRNKLTILLESQGPMN